MLAKRIIPCLDCDLAVPNGRVVKGIEFKQIRYAGIPGSSRPATMKRAPMRSCFWISQHHMSEEPRCSMS